MAINLGGNWAMLGHGMGAGFGKGVNESVSNTLDLLQRKKIYDLATAHGIDEQKAQKKYAREQLEPYAKFYGSEVADFLSGMPEKVRMPLLGNHQALLELQQSLTGQPGNALQQLVQPQEQAFGANEPQQMPQQQMNISPTDMLSMLSGGQPQTPLGLNMQLLQPSFAEATAGRQMPQAAAQMPQQPQIQQPISPAQALGRAFQGAEVTGKPATPHQLEMENIAKRKEQWQRQEPIRKYVEKEEEAYKKELQVGQLATSMRDTMEKIKKKWPSFIVGNMSESARNTFIRDDDVRTLMAQANELMILKAQTRKGLPSNFKVKLEGLAKADVSQPYNTAFNLIENTIKDVKRENKRLQYLTKMKKEDGTYPEDAVSRMLEYDLKKGGKIGQRSVLGGYEASKYPGKTLTNPRTGEVLKSDGSYWQPAKG